MAAPDVKSPVSEQIRQLNDARKLVLGDVNYYPTIVQGILPIISPASLPELRRWGAEFLAEAFATPALPAREKETLSLLVLESLKGMVENPKEDPYVLRSVIQAAASIYPLAMRWMYVYLCYLSLIMRASLLSSPAVGPPADLERPFRPGGTGLARSLRESRVGVWMAVVLSLVAGDVGVMSSRSS